jgi:uncharacterized tellurite resistance protein B-like protein
MNIFSKEKDKPNNNESLTRIASLLIHAAKIDEEYTEEEKQIINKTLIELGAESSDVNNIIANAVDMEQNSNQILDFTKEIKGMPDSNKNKLIETLWKIIYSNSNADMYETNLMRRLAGLLYIDDKTMGDLKEKVRMELSK